jgi:hypothetical protein
MVRDGDGQPSETPVLSDEEIVDSLIGPSDADYSVSPKEDRWGILRAICTGILGMF